MIYLKTIVIIFALLAAWLFVQAATQRFAKRHPDLYIEHEEGCCGCSNNCKVHHKTD